MSDSPPDPPTAGADPADDAAEAVPVPAKPAGGATQPEPAPMQPVDGEAQEEAARDRAEGGGYT